MYYADLKLPQHANLDKQITFVSLINEWIGGFSYVYNVGPLHYLKTNYNAPKSKVIAIDFE